MRALEKAKRMLLLRREASYGLGERRDRCFYADTLEQGLEWSCGFTVN